MKKLIFWATLFYSLSVFGQDVANFKAFEKDWTKAAKSNLKEKELDGFMEKYDTLFFPEGESEIAYYPLVNFKQTTAYKNNIRRLLNAKNPMHRILAYKTIGSAADTTFNQIILDRLNSETNESCLTWAAMCLLYNRNKSTSRLFEFVVKHDDFEDQHFYKWYLRLDTLSLINTAWAYVDANKLLSNNSNLNQKARIYTLQILAWFDKSPKTDSLIIQCINTWDKDYRGYAIQTLLARDKIEKFPILEPYLNEQSIKEISILVLEKSAYASDRSKALKLKMEK